MRFLSILTTVALVLAPTLPGQSVSAHVSAGDAAQPASDPAAALAHYEAAIAADSTDYEALWKASRAISDLAEYEADKDKREHWYRQAEQYARRAVARRPNGAEAHFDLARALGRVALSKGPKDRVKFGKEIREHALEALRLKPDHPGALHVMGMWNAEVRRLPGVARFFAKTFLGGKVMGSASWGEAVRHLERAVEVDPGRIVHHLDLARIYADVGEHQKARSRYEHVLQAAPSEYNDRRYKEEARAELERLKRD